MWLCDTATGCDKGNSNMSVALEEIDHPRIREKG